MVLQFFKYQGTGNDFVIIDNRLQTFPKNDTKLIAKLCDRKFGIGGDGLILLENDKMSDFKMVYYNADGAESTMCGNGGRCLVAFANYLGVINGKTSFNAIDGLHHATIVDDIVELNMTDVDEVKIKPAYSFLDTGSPHHVQLIENLSKLDVQKEGAKLRYGLYGQVGSNINFVEQLDSNSFGVRTYERGVEDETLSCGTGVTAVAIAMHKLGKTSLNSIEVSTPGGNLTISFDHQEGSYRNIYLKGSAKQVYKGEIKW
ncbi:MAG: diaminopimelate epimerase [Bacteroidota bacterium]